MPKHKRTISTPKTAERFIDLHTHSTASDGTSTPTEVVQHAKSLGITALALTDHDTTAGVAEAQAAAREAGIDFLTGIEISCEFPRPGTMHILGYGIDPDSPKLQKQLADLVTARNERNDRIIASLQAKGIPITLDMVKKVARGVVGRPHIARVLMDLRVVSNNAQAFREYLGNSGSVYADKERLTAAEAIGLITDAGGIASLAHPVQLQRDNFAQLRLTIKNLVDVGLGALEVIHSDHRESLINELSDIADKYDLLKTGGSDFHGKAKPHIQLGFVQHRRRIPREFYDALVERLSGSVGRR
jgi:3',5'-nucleoside bisphosphate phosphatase